VKPAHTIVTILIVSVVGLLACLAFLFVNP
jgi:hypothetical protein